MYTWLGTSDLHQPQSLCSDGCALKHHISPPSSLVSRPIPRSCPICCRVECLVREVEITQVNLARTVEVSQTFAHFEELSKVIYIFLPKLLLLHQFSKVLLRRCQEFAEKRLRSKDDLLRLLLVVPPGIYVQLLFSFYAFSCSCYFSCSCFYSCSCPRLACYRKCCSALAVCTP